MKMLFQRAAKIMVTMIMAALLFAPATAEENCSSEGEIQTQLKDDMSFCDFTYSDTAGLRFRNQDLLNAYDKSKIDVQRLREDPFLANKPFTFHSFARTDQYQLFSIDISEGSFGPFLLYSSENILRPVYCNKWWSGEWLGVSPDGKLAVFYGYQEGNIAICGIHLETGKSMNPFWQPLPNQYSKEEMSWSGNDILWAYFKQENDEAASGAYRFRTRGTEFVRSPARLPNPRNVKPHSDDYLKQLQRQANLFETASTAAELALAFDALWGASMMLEDSATVAGLLNKLNFTPKTITIAELETDFLKVTAGYYIDYLYHRAEQKNIEIIVPKSVFKATVNNTLYVKTANIKAATKDLAIQAIEITEAWTGLQSTYTYLRLRQLESAIVELDAFLNGKMSYEFVMEQIRYDRDLSIAMYGAAGNFWSVDTVERMGMIADIQELSLRMLNGEDVERFKRSIQAEYKGRLNSDQVATLLGVKDW